MIYSGRLLIFFSVIVYHRHDSLRVSHEETNMHSPDSNAIKIEGLTKEYNGLTALDKIDLDVGEGEFFGLLGPNGAGKTTTINILSGLCNKTAGDVQLFGHDLIQEYRECRRNVGLVPQEFNFDQFARLLDMLVFQGGFFGIPNHECKSRSIELLRKFDLIDKADTQLRHLSGGMKRRAIIMRALVHKPRLLILDEPTAGVDVDLRKSLWSFLRELHSAGTTILLTTHYLEEAETLCDRIAIIDHGRIVADDSTRNLVNKLNRESIIVTTMAEISEDVIGMLKQYNPAISGDRHELTLSFARGDSDFDSMLRRMMEVDIRIASIRPVDNRLEQVFLQLTRGNSGP